MRKVLCSKITLSSFNKDFETKAARRLEYQVRGRLRSPPDKSGGEDNCGEMWLVQCAKVVALLVGRGGRGCWNSVGNESCEVLFAWSTNVYNSDRPPPTCESADWEPGELVTKIVLMCHRHAGIQLQS